MALGTELGTLLALGEELTLGPRLGMALVAEIGTLLTLGCDFTLGTELSLGLALGEALGT
jgi:hypothetical protein